MKPVGRWAVYGAHGAQGVHGAQEVQEVHEARDRRPGNVHANQFLIGPKQAQVSWAAS